VNLARLSDRSVLAVDLPGAVLTMLGMRTKLLDTGGGLATHMDRPARFSDALSLQSFRLCAAKGVNIVEGVIAVRDAIWHGMPGKTRSRQKSSSPSTRWTCGGLDWGRRPCRPAHRRDAVRLLTGRPE
jgi:hypothetical protein